VWHGIASNLFSSRCIHCRMRVGENVEAYRRTTASGQFSALAIHK
jgi:hypothetical protein